jgi:predicted porin
LSLWVNKWERVRGNVRYTFSETPVFDRSFGVAVEPADSRSTEVTLNLYPTRSLVAELGVRQTRLTRRTDGVELSSALIPRVRAQYQFTRSLFVRGIFEYSSQERLGLRDPATGLSLYRVDQSGEYTLRSGSEGYDVHIEGLVSYEPSPGTVFYVGYARQMEDTESFRFREVRAMADGLFVKLSYRFRM